MKMIGYVKPSAASWWANSTPEMSPSWMSTTRQVALLVEAQVRNVSAESKVSAPYPYADNRLAIAARISGSSSTTAIIFVTICHDIPRLRATTCHFDPHPEVGVDVPFGLMRFLCGLRSAKAD